MYIKRCFLYSGEGKLCVHQLWLVADIAKDALPCILCCEELVMRCISRRPFHLNCRGLRNCDTTLCWAGPPPSAASSSLCPALSRHTPLTLAIETAAAAASATPTLKRFPILVLPLLPRSSEVLQPPVGTPWRWVWPPRPPQRSCPPWTAFPAPSNAMTAKPVCQWRLHCGLTIRRPFVDGGTPSLTWPSGNTVHAFDTAEAGRSLTPTMTSVHGRQVTVSAAGY
jgi:hypothetical protein